MHTDEVYILYSMILTLFCVKHCFVFCLQLTSGKRICKVFMQSLLIDINTQLHATSNELGQCRHPRMNECFMAHFGLPREIILCSP